MTTPTDLSTVIQDAGVDLLDEHPTLTSETERLIAAEHLLAQHLPTMRSMDRIGLVIELRKILEGRS
jgi:hypothetical protein